MSRDVNGAYIFSGSGALIFSQENMDETVSEVDLEYLSNFISTIETIAVEIQEEDVKEIEFGNIKFFHTRDKLSKIQFLIKSDKDAKPKKIQQVLSNLMNIFLEKFTGIFTSPLVVKKEKMDAFIESISEILGTGKKVEYFLDKIELVK